MVKRRVLLPSLVAMFVLLGPGQALAAPTWLAGESQDGAEAVTGVPADVATDSSGNSVAVWAANPAAGGEVRAAFRPRGGPWGAPESLDGTLSTLSAQPRVAVQPDGEFVAVWLANNDGTVLRWARRPAGGDWSAAATIGGAGCCGIGALLASADGTVTLIDDGDGFVYQLHEGARLRRVRRAGAVDSAATSSPPRPTAASSRFAAGSSAQAKPCVSSPGGGRRVGRGRRGMRWWAPSRAPFSAASAVTANPDASYTAVWGESSDSESPPSGTVLSSDRGAGRGRWVGRLQARR